MDYSVNNPEDVNMYLDLGEVEPHRLVPVLDLHRLDQNKNRLDDPSRGRCQQTRAGDTPVLMEYSLPNIDFLMMRPWCARCIYIHDPHIIFPDIGLVLI
jgi:hypothetical protein